MFPGAPKTLYASAAYYIDDLHTKIGVKVLQDKIGYTSSTDIDLIYSYATKIDYYWRIQMGLALSYQNQSYDITKIDATTPTDNTLYNLLLNQSHLNADIGFEMTDDIWLFGISGQNLASLFRDENARF
ncbi:MAG: type IX secretion system membrane protein PorP/SprF [Paludibacteraceae bacterium]